MKKIYLWIFAATMAVTALVLVGLQIVYLWQAKQAREHDFELAVKSNMRKVVHSMELREATDALIRASRDSLHAGAGILPVATDSIAHTHYQHPAPHLAQVSTDTSLDPYEASLLHQRYLTQRRLVEEAATWLLTRSERLKATQRINITALDYELQQAFAAAGIDLKFHVRLFDSQGNEHFRCSDYEERGQEKEFRQEIFEHSHSDNRGVLVVHFPEYEQYLYKNAEYSIITLILCVLFILSFAGCIYYALHEKRLSEMKRDFVSNMTHELKTPVATIDLAVQMLSEPGILQIERIVQKNMAIIRSEAQRLRFLIDKVLEISLYEQGSRLLNKQPIDMNALITDAVSTFEVQNDFHKGGIELHIEAKHANVRVDRTHLTNIVFNLLDNAIKYRKPEVEPHFIVRTWNEYDTFCFALTDNGIGIKAKDLKHIFDTYYRVSTKNRHDVKGFGLGLAYVRKIVASHDAKIDVESTFGIGTTFTIKIPLYDPMQEGLETQE